MPFFQNLFTHDFQGIWLLADRQHIPNFNLPQNTGRGAEKTVVWKKGPYNLSGNDADGNPKSTLKITYSLRDLKKWATMSINIASGAASASAVTAGEIVAILNADAIFIERFTATLESFPDGDKKVAITQKRPQVEFQFYINNGQAEEALGFNARAGVAELPSYFARHTIENRFNFADSQNQLIELDPAGSNVDAALIDNAVNAQGVSKGYDSGNVSSDWALLQGRSGMFNFQKLTVDVNDRITQIIEYPAGAKAGDMARKTNYQYSGAQSKPTQITEIPYVLTDSDLVTP